VKGTRKQRKGSARIAAHNREKAPNRSPYVVGFFLVPSFPMMSVAAAIEPLRSANRLRGARLFDWRLYSRDGAPVLASNGVAVAVHAGIGENALVDLLLVCAGTRDVGARDAGLAKWLRAQSRRGVAIGGVSLGSYALAHAGLLDGRRCALHWESLAAFAERFPRVRTTPDLFVVDGDRRTCAGGTAALDMMLALIAEREGGALANDVSEQFIHPRIRRTDDPQRMAVQTRVGVANDKLVAAVAMMESSSDEPHRVQAIAAAVGLSQRQLERLFVKYLEARPARSYLALRLARARMLLLQTAKPILDVAVSCGFASASHFSRCYRAAYGRRPSDERQGRSGEAPRCPSRSARRRYSLPA
jgi:transcriptional regulator GlxA family with amidase domain